MKTYNRSVSHSSLKPNTAAILAQRKLKRAYALSDAHAKLIAELYYGWAAYE